jgi:hypothetical protein
VGSNYNGKQVYTRRTGANRLSNEEVAARRAKLCDLEQKFLAKISPGGAARSAPPAAATAPVAGSQQPDITNLGGSAINLQQLLQQQQQQQQGGVSVSASGVELRGLGGQSSSNAAGQANAGLPRSITMPEVPQQQARSAFGGSSSNNDLSNLFQGLVGAGANSSSSMEAAIQQMMAQQQQSSSSQKVNSKAAAAGRALLQSGGGLGLGLGGSSSSSKAEQNISETKPLSSFTSAELAAELRKRSSLKDLIGSLGGGGGSSSSHRQASLTSLQDSLQQAAAAGADGGNAGASAFASLMRNQSLDMGNLIERQGSIDSLSNLAIRSHLQSLQSMGSLFGDIDIGQLNSAASANKNWTPSSQSNSLDRGGSNDVNNRLQNALAAAKASAGDRGVFSASRRTANELMESLGMNRNSLSNLASQQQEQQRRAASAISSSGLNLASLLNSEDALRKLEASAPSSLSGNFNWSTLQDNPTSSDSNNQRRQQQQQQDNNTAIAQFLLQKQLLDGKKEGASNGINMSDDAQQQIMMNAAAVAMASSNNASSSNNNSSNNNSGMDPFMSSILSSLRSAGEQQQQQQEKQQQDDLETLKRKFFSQEGLMAAAAAAVQEGNKRHKPF